ncbi:MAG: YjbQ family protein [Myxococcales bacterium]|nr:MAG: YjbQ family protein [Myxococcales bacterium]
MAIVFEIGPTEARQCLEITDQVRHIVQESGVDRGLCHVAVLHATAAVIVNENDDPNIGVDLLRALEQAVPEHDGWLHDRVDNNAAAHIKASMLGPSETLPVADGDLLLGTWQGIMVVELDGPRRRRQVAVTLIQA